MKNMKTTIEYKNIKEVVHVYEHSSGLKAFVIPKKGYLKKHATFSVHYGSVDNQFIPPGKEDVLSVPNGVAHFLEHKLFEQEDGDAMTKFSELGASCNAYTNFNQTGYLFSCTDKFNENLELLLNFVQNPYITEKSVEKERGIIAQEIKMYEDNHNWVAFFNLLEALFVVHPVRINIAGSVGSINKIDRRILYECYNTFYHPSNMAVVVVGDVAENEVFSQIDQRVRVSGIKPEIKRIFESETENINKDYIERRLHVSLPFFQMGFKDDISKIEGSRLLKHEIAMRILLEMIFGKSSDIYNRLYNEGLINHSFGFESSIEQNYGFSVFGGESNDPMKVRDIILHEIGNLHKTGLNKVSYERIKKAINGKNIKLLNSVEGIAAVFLDSYFKGYNFFDYYEHYDKLTYIDLQESFSRHFNMARYALSVVNPM